MKRSVRHAEARGRKLRPSLLGMTVAPFLTLGDFRAQDSSFRNAPPSARKLTNPWGLVKKPREPEGRFTISVPPAVMARMVRIPETFERWLAKRSTLCLRQKCSPEGCLLVTDDASKSIWRISCANQRGAITHFGRTDSLFRMRPSAR